MKTKPYTGITITLYLKTILQFPSTDNKYTVFMAFIDQYMRGLKYKHPGLVIKYNKRSKPYYPFEITGYESDLKIPAINRTPENVKAAYDLIRYCWEAYISVYLYLIHSVISLVSEDIATDENIRKLKHMYGLSELEAGVRYFYEGGGKKLGNSK